MKYKLFRILGTNIGNQNIEYIQEIDNIEWRKYNYERNIEDVGGYISNSFNSPEECYEKIKKLFNKRKDEEWDEFSLSNSETYTCLPILKF